jgi:hypothetical protein
MSGATAASPSQPLTLGRLLLHSGGAVLHPVRAFQHLRNDARPPYIAMVCFLIGWGGVFSILHFLTVDHRGLWTYDREGQAARLLTFVLGSPSVWLLGSLGVWTLAKVCRHPVSVGWADTAAFYLWTVWALMPVIDCIHLFGLPTRSVAVPGISQALLGHASWVVFPVILVELTALFAILLRGRRRWWLLAPLSAVGGLLFARLILEPLPDVMVTLLGRRGYSLESWTVNVWLLGVALIWLLGWRCAYSRLPRWVVIAGALLASGQLAVWAVHTRFSPWG